MNDDAEQRNAYAFPLFVFHSGQFLQPLLGFVGIQDSKFMLFNYCKTECIVFYLL